MRRSQIELLEPPSGRVVFLGDSITEQGHWDEWFPELATLNRGIGGETIGDVLGRLDSAINDPTAISVLVGTNDLSGMAGVRAARDLDALAARMRTLVAELKRRAPDALLLVNSVMPRKPAYTELITTLNNDYARIAEDLDATFIDLWPALASAEHGLRDDFTSDHLHLNGAGYRAWVEVLRPHLGPFATAPH